ncbi:MAG: hypothetical protein R6T78_00330 [Dehalococcoidales bacterium]
MFTEGKGYARCHRPRYHRLRVSPVRFALSNLGEVPGEAEKSTAVTRNHPGVKGAQAVAAATFLLRLSTEKREIRMVRDCYQKSSKGQGEDGLCPKRIY